MLGFLSFKVHI